MDPITVVGFVAAIVQLIDVTSKVVNYFNDIKDAPKDRAKLSREAGGLLALLIDLRYRVEETTSTNPWFAGLRSLGGERGPLMDFKHAMEEIADKLVPTTGVKNLKRALRWKFDKKEIEAILSKIERLKTLIGLALQKDHFELSLAMKEEITVGFREMKTNGDDEKINIWLAAPLPSLNQNTAMKKRQPSTGEWFTQGKEFVDWKVVASSFIWLHGIPGCGKTILCSTIIQDVISNYQSSPTVGVAYFYFDFNDPEKQQTEKLIRSLIVQFAAQCQDLPESLQSAYSQSQNGQKQPTIEQMTTILCHLLKKFSNAYIMLDALDECTDREDLLEFIEALVGWKVNDLHILATSRKENDITTSLESLVTCQLSIQNALVDRDIRVHILERLTNDPRLKKWPVDVQKEMEIALMDGASGMFRWVVCQLESLRKCIKLDSLRKTLITLPKTLDDTYERILSNLDEEYEDDVLKTLQWLCFSKRPIRINEMAEVLAVDLNFDCRFRPEQRLPDPRDILTICSTLVSVAAAGEDDLSGETEELRLAHFSVKEYLISDRLKNAPMHCYHITPLSANISIAKACLAYLLHFKSPTILTARFDYDFPLIRYAAEFWPKHHKHITDDANRDAVEYLGCNLVDSDSFCFINWLRIFDPDRVQWGKSNLKREKNEMPSPLYYMSYLGVNRAVQLLLNKDVDVNAEGGSFGYALSAASGEGYEEVVQLLLDSGANVNAEGGILGSALAAALCGGNEKVVQLLLESGANVNAEGGFFGSALAAASYTGHETIVRLLLETGANINAKGGKYGHALAAASYGGHEKVVQLLLARGANVNAEGGDYRSALSAASYGGHEKVVQLLLESGANVNAEGGEYGGALAAASREGHETIVRLLLETGANINAKGGEYGHALAAASYGGHEKVVQLLLASGANVNAEGGDYGSALGAASREGHETIVRLLLEKGANINAKGGKYGHALAAASYRGHEKVVQLLLESGANVNAEGGEYGGALAAASREGHETIVRLLLETGANINAKGGKYGHALAAASYGGHEKVVQLLLESGANVNAEGGDYRSALSAASYGGHEKVVQLLLESGANVNAEGETYGSALVSASHIGHEKIVRLLLETGAKINAEGGIFGSALAAASGGGHEKVVQLLLESGANVNAEGGFFGSAMAAASYGGHEKVVQLLLESGANVNAEGDYYGGALAAASYRGHEKVVQLLLESGANVNAEGGDYGGALGTASREGHETIVRLLLETGANINAKGGKYGHALAAASYGGHEKVVQILLESGANVNAEGGDYRSALAAASSDGQKKVAQLLLEEGDYVGTQRERALQKASEESQKAVMRLLLKNKADVNLVLHDNDALQEISVDDHEAVIQLLLKELGSSYVRSEVSSWHPVGLESSTSSGAESRASSP